MLKAYFSSFLSAVQSGPESKYYPVPSVAYTCTLKCVEGGINVSHNQLLGP